MDHPQGRAYRQEEWHHKEVKRSWWWLWALPTLAVGVLLFVLDLEPGVLDLELAGTRDGAQAVLDAWGDDKPLAAWSVVIDFLFILLYVITLYRAARWAGQQALHQPARYVSRPMAWAAIGAGVFDILENIGLLVVLAEDATTWWAGWIATFAWGKWVLVALTGGYSLTLVVQWALRKLRERLIDRVPDWLLPVVEWLPQEFNVPEDPTRRRARPEGKPGLVGICCSGGGIRSASYNLGALQALAEHDVLTQADEEAIGRDAAAAAHLAAVSGGGYMAGAFTSVFVNTDRELITAEPAFAPGSPEERRLRTCTDYLASGLTGKLSAVGYLLSGIVVNVAIIAAVVFTFSRPIGWLAGSAYVNPNLDTGYEVPVAVWALVAFAAVMGIAVLPSIGRFIRRTRVAFRHDVAQASYLTTAMGAVVLIVLILIPELPDIWRWAEARALALVSQEVGDATGLAEAFSSGSFLQIASALAGISAVAAAVRGFVAKKKSYFASTIAGLVVPVALIGGFLWSAVSAGRHGRGGELTMVGIGLPESVWWLIVAAVLLVCVAALDVTRWSMHLFYRRRLKSAYVLRRNSTTQADEVPDREEQELRMSNYGMTPEFIACAAANVRTRGVAPPGRAAVSFTFTSSEAGLPDYAMTTMSDMEATLGPRRRADVSLPAVIAISGAAISPGMGKMSNRALSALLTIFNLRLGVWLPNPLWVDANMRASKSESGSAEWSDRPRITHLFKEMFSMYRITDRYLYVTDGGHWENLGLVELLRRGCTEVYVFDASGDTAETFNTIGQAIALARIELGVDIDLRPERMRPEKPKRRRRAKGPALSPLDHVDGRIRYPDGTEGRIVLCKAAVTADAPADVRFFQERSPKFPNHSTIEQLFRDERFEAYRALGYYTAQQACASIRPRPEGASS